MVDRQVGLTEQRHRVEIDDGLEIAVVERGVGPVLLLVPGWTMSSS